MPNRTRKPLAAYTCRPNGQLTVRDSKPSAYARTRQILAELGQDVKDYQREVKLRTLFRQYQIGLL
jgi:hypothetical protein